VTRAEADDQGEGSEAESRETAEDEGKGEARGASSISRSIIPGVWGASESVVGEGVE